MMTVEAKYLDLVHESETHYFEIDSEQNIENISPLQGELMVAIKPLISNCNLPLISKINISERRNGNSEKEVLKESSPVKDESNEKDVSNVFSPIERTIDNVDNELTAAKMSLAKDLASSNCSITSTSVVMQQLSQSADANNLQHALKSVQNNLSSSCFAELSSEKVTSDIDSELTCLNWLQGSNLLKEFSPGSNNDSSEKDVKSDVKAGGCNENFQHNSKDPFSSINEVDKSLRKPSYSFSTLIFMAIESSPNKRLPVKDIYQWIQDNFPYFQRAPIGWKNSIRHNLSLNKSFKKVDKEKCIGKGSLWTIDHQARAGLVQQLRKTPAFNTYPYMKPTPTNGCSRYFSNNRKLNRRDATGRFVRFVPNHDDAEFDVAAAMCSLSSAALIDYQNNSCTQSNGFDYVSSEELLQIWRTCIEPRGEYSGESSSGETTLLQNWRNPPENAKYTIEDFLNEVENKLSFKSKSNFVRNLDNAFNSSLNVSMDEDYEFDKSDEESSDEEMRENMLRLVEKESDETFGDSGYSEEGTLKSATMLDHSYSKSIQSLVRPHAKREVKGVDALWHLANAATRELENLTNRDKATNPGKDLSNNYSNEMDFQIIQCSESKEVCTADKSCQYPSISSDDMSTSS